MTAQKFIALNNGAYTEKSATRITSYNVCYTKLLRGFGNLHFAWFQHHAPKQERKSFLFRIPFQIV